MAGTISNATFSVNGYRDLVAASKLLVPAEKRAVREAFARSGELVRADAAPRLAKYSTRSASGLRVRVRQRGVEVEQSIRKTTGFHPQFGSLQMKKALLPALYKKQDEIVAEFDKALSDVSAIFNNA